MRERIEIGVIGYDGTHLRDRGQRGPRCQRVADFWALSIRTEPPVESARIDDVDALRLARRAVLNALTKPCVPRRPRADAVGACPRAAFLSGSHGQAPWRGQKTR